MRGHKRLVGVYCVIVLLMTGLIYRIYYINMSDFLATAADMQGQYYLPISNTRGMIYDRNLQALVNTDQRYVAAVMPTPQNASVLVNQVEEEERGALLERLGAGFPFAMEMPGNNIYAGGVDIFRIPVRYGETQYAPHVIGYLTGDGKNGAAGIEKSYDSWLNAQGEELSMHYRLDAAGRVLTGSGADVSREGSGAKGGVVLSLDSQIQILTQNALKSGAEKGAAVVMDVYTGDILAMASLPAFDQNDIAASLDSADAPFINRAISGYNIGSIFKLIVCAAALENGISTDFTHVCEGGLEVDGRLFRCNNSAVHGEVDMYRALQVSCNAYFISLAQEMDPAYLVSLAENLGLGSSTELAEGIYTQAGNLPAPSELANAQAYANFSFGQGSSLASPLQMARVVSAFANSGFVVNPRLVQGFTEDGEQVVNATPAYVSNQVVSERTSGLMRSLMTSVVEEGSGRTAKPVQGSAGGKTSSAQTGQYVEEEEIVHAWFAGYYPAEQPRYAIVVFVEGGESGEYVAAPVFKQIADGIGGLTQGQRQLPLGYSG